MTSFKDLTSDEQFEVIMQTLNDFPNPHGLAGGAVLMVLFGRVMKNWDDCHGWTPFEYGDVDWGENGIQETQFEQILVDLVKLGAVRKLVAPDGSGRAVYAIDLPVVRKAVGIDPPTEH